MLALVLLALYASFGSCALPAWRLSESGRCNSHRWLPLPLNCKQHRCDVRGLGCHVTNAYKQKKLFESMKIIRMHPHILSFTSKWGAAGKISGKPFPQEPSLFSLSKSLILRGSGILAPHQPGQWDFWEPYGHWFIRFLTACQRVRWQLILRAFIIILLVCWEKGMKKIIGICLAQKFCAKPVGSNTNGDQYRFSVSLTLLGAPVLAFSSWKLNVVPSWILWELQICHHWSSTVQFLPHKNSGMAWQS